MNLVCFGGGTNSAAMIIGMKERGMPIDLILFSDTGGEQPHTYAFINIFDEWLSAQGLPPITKVFTTNKRGERLILEQECLTKGVLPSIAYGFKKCSNKYKVRPQDKFCNNYKPFKEIWLSGRRINKYVGYDAGETRRVEHAKRYAEADKKYNSHYLLYEWGWGREDCAAAIERVGLPLPGKSSCFFCPSMKKHEIQHLWENFPELWQRAVEIEHAAAPTLTTIKGLGRKWSWESYRTAFEKAQRYESTQITLFDFIESPGGCLCDAPCGCYDG